AFVTSLAVGGCGDIRDAVSEVPAEPDEEIQPEPEGQPDTQPDVAEPDAEPTASLEVLYPITGDSPLKDCEPTLQWRTERFDDYGVGEQFFDVTPNDGLLMLAHKESWQTLLVRARDGKVLTQSESRVFSGADKRFDRHVEFGRNELRVRQMITNDVVTTLEAPEGHSFQAAAISQDGGTVASLTCESGDYRLWVRSIDGGGTNLDLHVVSGGEGGFCDGAYNPRERILFTSGDDVVLSVKKKIVHVKSDGSVQERVAFDFPDVEEGVFLPERHRILSLAVPPSGESVVATSSDGELRVFKFAESITNWC
ncbi:MAG: hypothetical protein GY822_02195, partial [Deltaproteobacteria bacterium]|nr:hypothetical protein [Deltaproteobacteria bacterium]